MSDLQAACLCAQLERWQEIQARRAQLWQRYAQELRGWAHDHGVRLPVVPAHCEQAYHMFYLLLPSLAARTALIAHLKAAGVMAVFHYLPLHLSDMGRSLGGRPGACPVTEDVSDRLLRLPFFYNLSDEDQERAIAATLAFRP
jgi:dTDP-4-amino-4,6-dideoxygalactose transaminase